MAQIIWVKQVKRRKTRIVLKGQSMGRICTLRFLETNCFLRFDSQFAFRSYDFMIAASYPHYFNVLCPRCCRIECTFNELRGQTIDSRASIFETLLKQRRMTRTRYAAYHLLPSSCHFSFPLNFLRGRRRNRFRRVRIHLVFIHTYLDQFYTHAFQACCGMEFVLHDA